MSRPLAGIRVLDLTQVLAGPFACRLLGDLGADVIKVEQPGLGDPSRSFAPYFLNGQSAYFLGLNGNKRGITLNLREAMAREAFYDLAQKADVLVENYRPSVPPRLGIDYETIKGINPRIVYCSISGFGLDSDNPDRPAFDTTIQALGGAMSVIGHPGQPPSTMGFAVGDLGASYAAVSGILAALVERGKTGQGRHVDLALLDVMVTLQGYIGQFYLISGDEPGPLGSTHPTNIPVTALKCKDGVYIQAQFPSQPLYQALAEKLAAMFEEYTDLPNDPRFANPGERLNHKQELTDVLGEVFAKRTSDEWLDLLEGTMPIARVNSIAQSLAEPSVLKRNMTPEVDHPVSGRYKIIGNPLKMGQEEVFEPAPTLGQHNEEVFGQFLGYGAEKIQAMRDVKAI